MSLVASVVLLALPVQGSMKLDLDAFSYPTRDGRAEVELSYDVPYTSLSFLKQDGGFRAEFSIGIQLLDRRGEPIAGDQWLRAVEVAEYEQTVRGDSSASGAVTIAIDSGVVRARVEVADRGSSRRATASFPLTLPVDGLRLKFLKSGEPNPARGYRLEDTLEVLAEVTDSVGVDSFRFAVRDGRRVYAAATVSPDSASRQTGLFQAAIADSLGVARIPGGEHELEAVGFQGDDRVAGRAGFRVDVPFFFDDDAFADKADELLYIASTELIRELKALPPGEREQGWREFWRKHDPTPTTERNEKEEEYFERIEYCKERFGRGDRGYRSDRARIYVRYGPPDNVDSRPFELDRRAYEVWTYYSLGLQFVFVDRSGFGEYILENPTFNDGR